MAPDTPAVDLLTTLAHRHALFERVLEEPTDRQTLATTLDHSWSTVDRVCQDLADQGLLELVSDEVTPTLFATLVWETYCTFEQHLATIEDLEDDTAPLWDTIDDRRDVIQLIADRFDVLEALEMTSLDKRGLVAALDASRSTIDRTIRELEMARLVDWTDNGYTTTPAGRQAAAQYRVTAEMISDILAAQAIITVLPYDCPLPPDLFADATVESADSALPYYLPEGVRTRIEAANHVRLVLPALATPQLLDCCQRAVVQSGLTLEVLTSPALFETLTTEFPGPLAAMAATDSCTAFVADIASDSQSIGLVLADSEGQRPSSSRIQSGDSEGQRPSNRGEQSSSGSRLPADDSQTQSGDTGGATTVSVIVYGGQRTVQGTIHTNTADASQWAEDHYAQLREGASDVTADLRDLTPAGTAPASVELGRMSDTERVTREAEGFVQLTPAYFAQRAPAPPVTGWRTGFDLVDVHAGYAIDREYEHDDTRHNLTEDLTARLAEGTNQAVLGPPGSGKSTICKAVACRWYEQGIGPVFYRESGTGATFNSPAVLKATLRATDSHALVVVEDAVRSEANALFGLMQAFRGDTTVTFLLDARASEWDDSEMLPTDAGLEAYRSEAIETITVPDLDDREYDRFVHQFEQTVDHDLDSAAIHQLQESRSEPAEGQLQVADHGSAADGLGELLLLLHRLVMATDPLAVYDVQTPTTLVEDVQRTYETLHNADELTLDVGVLVNLLNAAGLGVSSDLVCALADDETSVDDVRAALSVLEGRIIFTREKTTAGPYRTIHEEWSTLFLTHLIESETERAAGQRVGRCLTALLSLADDKPQRARISAAFGSETPGIERIIAAPSEWADTTVEQLFRFGQTHPGLASLFDTTDDSCIELPDACSLSVVIDCTLRRAVMAFEASDLERAADEYERLGAFAPEIEETDPEEAATLRGQRLNGLGLIASQRNEFDTAGTYYTRALDHYYEADNTLRIADISVNRGWLAYLRGDLTTAETYYQQGLDMYREIDHKQKERIALHGLGVVLTLTGDLETAIDHCRQALERYRKQENRRDEAYCLISLGTAVAAQGDLNEATIYCTQALELSRETGTLRHEAESLEQLGHIQRQRGDFDTAESYCQQSLDIRQDIDSKRAQADSFMALGLLAHERGALDTAEEYCTTSHEMYREIDDQRGEATSVVTLGEIAREQGALNIAIERAQASLSQYQTIGHRHGPGTCHRLLGQIACNHEQFTTAEDHFMRALTVFRDTGYQYETARTLAALGSLARAQTDLSQAREHFAEAVEVYREIGAVRDTIETTERLAAVCEACGDHTAALEHCETVHALAQDTEFIEVSASLDERRTQLADHRVSDDGS